MYFLKRLFGLLPVLFIITSASFFLMRFAPGGPFDSEKLLSGEIEENIRKIYKLDAPLWEQYLSYLKGACMGDFGYTFSYPDTKVSSLIAKSFRTSLVLGSSSFILALIAGFLMGIIGAAKRGKFLDHLFFSFTILGVSIPAIVLGPILIMVFGLWLKIFPVAGWGTFREAVLPVITLSLIYASFIARISRESCIEIGAKDYVKTARSLGVKEWKIYAKYVLRGSLLPVISYITPAFAGIITGSLVIEKIFFIPGLGSHFVEAALNRDYPLAMGTVVFYSAILLVLNLIADLLYTIVDPRVSYE
jgi:oligopeptide transport system permease protein